MAPKRKVDANQPSLEEFTDAPVIKKHTQKGKLSSPKVTKNDTAADELRAQRLKRKHGADPAFQKKPEEEYPEGDKPKGEKPEKVSGKTADEPDFVDINRAPTLTLWVQKVAERQGFSKESGLSFGKAIAGIMAQSKGRSIGVFEAKEPDQQARENRHSREEELGVEMADVFGMKIKALRVAGELRALDSGSDSAIEPKKVQQYLARAFKDRLADVEAVMKELAASYTADEIGDEAYHLYEQFRPSVAQGQQGWGRKGRLDFEAIRSCKK